jgi:hypothetical protein
VTFPRLTVEDAQRCGMGRGADCCAYLVVAGAEGFKCGRVEGPLAAILIERALAGTMGARRLPTAAYPACQLVDDAVPADVVAAAREAFTDPRVRGE